MAILDTDGTYVKLNYENCGVVGGKVYAEFFTYQNEWERCKEKARQKDWAVFQNRCAEKCGELYRAGQEKWNYQTKSQEEIEADPQFRKDCAAYGKLTEFLSRFEENVFRSFGEAAEVLSDDVVRELRDLGFDPVWTTDPVRRNGKVAVCCGDYDMLSGGRLDEEFFYNHLKSQMSESVQNV